MPSCTKSSKSWPPVAQDSVIGLIESLAKAFGTTSSKAQLGLVVFLSILLDFFAAFFVGAIGEEQRFCHFFQNYKEKKAEHSVDPPKEEKTELAGLLPHYEQEQGDEQKKLRSQTLFKQWWTRL